MMRLRLRTTTRGMLVARLYRAYALGDWMGVTFAASRLIELDKSRTVVTIRKRGGNRWTIVSRRAA